MKEKIKKKFSDIKEMLGENTTIDTSKKTSRIIVKLLGAFIVLFY